MIGRLSFKIFRCTHISTLYRAPIPLPGYVQIPRHHFLFSTDARNPTNMTESPTSIPDINKIKDESNDEHPKSPNNVSLSTSNLPFRTLDATDSIPLWILDLEEARNPRLPSLKQSQALSNDKEIFKTFQSIQTDISSVATYHLIQIFRYKPSLIPLFDRMFMWKFYKELEKRKALGSLTVSDWEWLFSSILIQGSSCILSPGKDGSEDPDASSKEYGMAVHLIQSMKDCAIRPSSFIYTCLIRTLRQDPLQAHKVFVKLGQSLRPKPGLDSIITNKMIRTILAILYNPHIRIRSSSRLNAYREIWQIVVEHRISLTKESYIAFMDVFSTVKYIEGIDTIQSFLFLRFKDELKSDPSLIEAILKARFEAGDYPETIRLFFKRRNSGSKLTSEMCKWTLYAMEKTNDMVGIRDLYKTICRSRIRLDSGMIRTLLRAAGKSRDGRMIAHIYARIRMNLPSKSVKTHSPIAHSQKIPFKSSVYIPLIEALGKMTSTKKLMEVYDEYKSVRTIEVETENEAMGLGWVSTDDMIHALTSAHGLETITPPLLSRENQELLISHRREWRVPLVPRRALGAMIETMLLKKDLEGIEAFFETEVLNPQHLALHWAYQIHHDKLHLANQKKVVESRIQHLSQLGNHSSIRIPLQRFQKDLDRINHQLSEKCTPRTGADGVLSGIYSSMNRTLEEMSGTLTDDMFIWKVEALLKEFEEKELETIRNCSICKYFHYREKQKSSTKEEGPRVDMLSDHGAPMTNEDAQLEGFVDGHIPTSTSMKRDGLDVHILPN